MKPSILRTVLLSIALLIISSSALAQYAWIDDKGAKQFSDQPPPPDVPKNKILKFAGKMTDTEPVDADAAASTPAPTKAAPTLAEREMDYKKRHQQADAQAKKDEETAKNAAEKADSCKRQRDYKQSLDSGMRISQTDANGNRSFLSDQQRASEESTVNQYLTTCN